MSTNYEDIDWGGVDGDAQDQIALSFPAVQWRNGRQELEDLGAENINYTGGFFFSADNSGDGIQIPGWRAASFKPKAGAKVEGIAARRATISIVRSRRRWVQKDAATPETRPWSQYQSGFRAQLQAVGFIKGHPDPVIFAWKGMATNAFDDLRKDHAKLIAVVNRSAPTKGMTLPPYALWMTVEAGPHSMVGKKGDQSEATLPQIVLPKELTIEYARTQYVGNSLMAEWQQFYRELESWSHEWDHGTVGSGHGDDDASASLPSRSTPVRGATAGDNEARLRFYARGRAAGILDGDLQAIEQDVAEGVISWQDAIDSLPRS